MEIKRMHEMIEKLSESAECEFAKGIECVDTEEMGKAEQKWVIPLDGTVKCRKTNHLFVLQTDSTHITILPMRCIEPSVLPDVEAIILSGTIQAA